MEDFESLQFERELYFKLRSAEREEELTDKRYLCSWEPTGPGCWYISTPGFEDVCPIGLFVKVLRYIAEITDIR